MKNSGPKSAISAAIFTMAAFVLLSSCANPAVVWTEGEIDPSTGRAIHTLTVVNAPEGTDWKVWLTSNHIRSGVVDGTQGEISLFHGCLYQMTPYAHDSKDLVVT